MLVNLFSLSLTQCNDMFMQHLTISVSGPDFVSHFVTDHSSKMESIHQTVTKILFRGFSRVACGFY